MEYNIMASIIEDNIGFMSLMAEQGNKEYIEFIEYNDLGIPLALSLNADLVLLTDKGKEVLDETFLELRRFFSIPDDLIIETAEDFDEACADNNPDTEFRPKKD